MILALASQHPIIFSPEFLLLALMTHMTGTLGDYCDPRVPVQNNSNYKTTEAWIAVHLYAVYPNLILSHYYCLLIF